ncbi:MAG: DUF1854 domain-containing protein [Candidatus Brocadiia bacterium]
MTEEKQDNGAPQKGTFDLMETLAMLDTEGLRVERTAGEGLRVKSAELGELEGVTIEPCFPITEFGRYLLLKDGEGQELGILEDMRELDDASMKAVEAELKEQHFIPIITRVNDISREFHIPVWDVETDRGPRRLELKRRRDVHRMRGGRVYIRDAGGNGYLIPDIRELDPASRNLIETNT